MDNVKSPTRLSALDDSKRCTCCNSWKPQSAFNSTNRKACIECNEADAERKSGKRKTQLDELRPGESPCFLCKTNKLTSQFMRVNPLSQKVQMNKNCNDCLDHQKERRDKNRDSKVHSGPGKRCGQCKALKPHCAYTNMQRVCTVCRRNDAKRKAQKREELESNLKLGERTCQGCRQNKPESNFISPSQCNSCHEFAKHRRLANRGERVREKLEDWDEAAGCPGPGISAYGSCLIGNIKLKKLRIELGDDAFACLLDYDHNDGGKTKTANVASISNLSSRAKEKVDTKMRCTICHKVKTKANNENAKRW